jgi:Holliday junction resolvase RusA-like endonuclease
MQVIYGVIPSKSNLYKTTKNGFFYKDKKVKDYEKSFYYQCDLYRNKMITGSFGIKVNAYLKNTLQDLDGVFKCLFDCLQLTKSIENDRNCIKIEANKFIDKQNPRIEFELYEFNKNQIS